MATDFGDYGTILGRTGAGRLTAVEPGTLADGVVDVLSNPTLAARLAAASRPVAEEFFGMARNIDRYLAVYDRVLSSRPCLVSGAKIFAREW